MEVETFFKKTTFFETLLRHHKIKILMLNYNKNAEIFVFVHFRFPKLAA